MRTLLIIAIIILGAFTAIALLCAIRIALRPPAPARRDPFFHPFGDVPGFSDQQLREIARRNADHIARDPLRRSLEVTRDSGRTCPPRPDADGVGHPHSPRVHAVRDFFRRIVTS